MFSAIIVDDEPWALRGIRNSFNWEKYGFRVDLEASSAETALVYIRSSRPDVVFTDIRMDTMSGIEMIAETRKAGIQSEFVIISGHDDFSYAQQAIRNGVFRYLLKPVDLQATDELLADLVERLAEKHSVQTSSLVMDQLLENRTSFKDFFVQMNLPVIHEQFYAITMRGDIQLKHERMAPAVCPGYLIKTGHDQSILLTNCGTTDPAELIADVNESTRVGISSVSTVNDPVIRKIKESDIAMCNRFISDDLPVCRYQKSNQLLMNEMVARCLDIMNSDRKEDLAIHLSSIKEMLRMNQTNVKDIAIIYNHIVSSMMGNHHLGLMERIEYLDYADLLAYYGSLDSLFAFLKEVALDDRRHEMIGQIESNKYLPEIIAYISEHFDQPITLSDLSSRFYISQTYICDLFRKHMGRTFIDYIIDLRIRKAMRLLKETNTTIDAVAEMTGYNDYYYFNRIFKKKMGVTPYKYRQMNTSR